VGRFLHLTPSTTQRGGQPARLALAWPWPCPIERSCSPGARRVAPFCQSARWSGKMFVSGTKGLSPCLSPNPRLNCRSLRGEFSTCPHQRRLLTYVVRVEGGRGVPVPPSSGLPTALSLGPMDAGAVGCRRVAGLPSTAAPAARGRAPSRPVVFVSEQSKSSRQMGKCS